MSTKKYEQAKRKVEQHRALGLGKRLVRHATGKAPTSAEREEARLGEPGTYARLVGNTETSIKWDMKRLATETPVARDLQRKIGAINISQPRNVHRWEETVAALFEYKSTKQPFFDKVTIEAPAPIPGLLKETAQSALDKFYHNLGDVVIGGGPTPVPARKTASGKKAMVGAGVGLFAPNLSDKSVSESLNSTGIGLYVDSPDIGMRTVVITEQDVADMPPELHADFESMTDLFVQSSLGNPLYADMLPGNGQQPQYKLASMS